MLLIKQNPRENLPHYCSFKKVFIEAQASVSTWSFKSEFIEIFLTPPPHKGRQVQLTFCVSTEEWRLQHAKSKSMNDIQNHSTIHLGLTHYNSSELRSVTRCQIIAQVCRPSTLSPGSTVPSLILASTPERKYQILVTFTESITNT